MIDSLRLKHPLPMLCNQLDVAVSGYSAYCNGKLASSRKQDDLRLLTHTHALLASVGVESMGRTRFNLSLPHMASKWMLIVLKVCVRPLVFVASTNVNLELPETLNISRQLRLTCWVASLTS